MKQEQGNDRICIIRLGLNVALTHQNMSYRDSETKKNLEAQIRKQKEGKDRKRTSHRQLKTNYTKKKE